MKKMLKAFLCAMMVVVMMLSMVACNGGNNAATTENGAAAENDAAGKEESEKVVKEFMDAAMELDFKKASKYVVDGSDKELPFESKDDYIDEMVKTMPFPAEYEKDVRKFAEKVFDASIDCESYDIADSEKKDGEFVYTITLKTKDEDDLNEKTEKKTTTALSELVEELKESGEVTEEMSQEEIIEIIAPKTIELLEDVYLEAIEDADEAEYEFELTVSNVDGEWLISDSDLGNLSKDSKFRELLD